MVQELEKEDKVKNEIEINRLKALLEELEDSKKQLKSMRDELKMLKCKEDCFVLVQRKTEFLGIENNVDFF